jgi:HemY protein
MAAAEKGCGEDEKVISGWLAKSASAKRPPEWICSQCGNIDSWQPVCSKCHSFDSQIWSVPSQSTELHHGLTTLPFVLDNTSSDNSTDNLDFSESSENMSSEAEDSVQFDSGDKDDNYNTVTKGKGVDRGKEKEKSEIADNARKII